MDRCAMFVDAGYVHKMSELVLGKDHNSRQELDPEAVMTTLEELAQDLTGLPVLRIYWYDAASGKQPSPAHKELARQGAIKIRIGSLKTRTDGTVVQKGVDSEIHADMIDLARHGAVCDMVLVSGDEDLLRAVEDVQKQGVRVHLWGVDAQGTPNQSAELVMAADARHILAEAWVVSVHRHEEQPEPSQGAPASATPALPNPALPNPASLPVPGPKPMLLLTTEQQDFAPLSEISTIAERTQDDAEDTNVTFTPMLAGHRYGKRWFTRTTTAAVQRLRVKYPVIPRSIDGDVLRYAASMGIDTWDTPTKHEVRKGFWSAIQGS